MNVVAISERLDDIMYQVSINEDMTEAQMNYLLDLLDIQQKKYVPMSTGWIVIESFKDYVKDRS